jgi:hypothetical protein
VETGYRCVLVYNVINVATGDKRVNATPSLHVRDKIVQKLSGLNLNESRLHIIIGIAYF